MESEWKRYLFEDCMEAIIDYRGKTPKKTVSGVPLITAKIIKNGSIQPVKEFIAEEDYDSWMRRGIPEPGDVVLTTEAPLGEVAQLDERKIALAQRVITLRGKKGFLDNTFLKYLLISSDVQHQLDGRGTGTTVKGIKQSELRKLELPIPEYEIQKSIAHIIGSLDNKIQLNRQTNQTLEQMAQALFKSWFVDFDPVIDNALDAGNKIPEPLQIKAQQRAAIRAQQQAELEQANQSTLGDTIQKQSNTSAADNNGTEQTSELLSKGLPDHMRALFPSEFEETEALGWVPKGWEFKEVGKLIDNVGGGTPKTKEDSYWIGGTHAFCTPKDMSGLSSKVLLETERHLTDIGVSKISSGILPIGTVLMSSRAPIGYLAITKTPVSVNQGIIALKPNEKYSSEFLLCWTEANMEEVISRANGSTFLEISKKNFRDIPFLDIDESVLSAFSEVAQGYFGKITALQQQVNHLTKLRDTLLPKLISGELRLPDINTNSDKNEASA